MPVTYKNSQVQGTAAVGTYATLYGPVPASTQAIVSTIAICNTAATQATFRIGIMGSAGTPGASEWLCYDTVVASNDTTTLTLGLVIEAGQYIRVSSSANTVAFSAHYAENS